MHKHAYIAWDRNFIYFCDNWRKREFSTLHPKSRRVQHKIGGMSQVHPRIPMLVSSSHHQLFTGSASVYHIKNIVASSEAMLPLRQRKDCAPRRRTRPRSRRMRFAGADEQISRATPPPIYCTLVRKLVRKKRCRGRQKNSSPVLYRYVGGKETRGDRGITVYS